MKRAGHLMEKVVLIDNLYEAYLQAAKGKREHREVKVFGEQVFDNLNRLGQELMDGTYRFGGYNKFVIYEPKRRVISAAHFRDRVMMQAVMRVCLPVFESYQVYDSYACRVGKGQYKAIYRAQQFARRNTWFAKLDVRKFFDTIDHKVLLQLLKHKFKDDDMLRLFKNIIATYSTTVGKGLPIGNLTSQHFANHYLSLADHYLQEELHVNGMVRYMDDLLLFDNDKSRLMQVVKLYSDFLRERLKLTLHEPIVNKTCFGVPFLGYVVFPMRLHLNTASRRRFRRKVAEYTAWYDKCVIDDAEYHCALTSLYSFVEKADARSFMRQTIQQQGILP